MRWKKTSVTIRTWATTTVYLFVRLEPPRHNSKNGCFLKMLKMINKHTSSFGSSSATGNHPMTCVLVPAKSCVRVPNAYEERYWSCSGGDCSVSWADRLTALTSSKHSTSSARKYKMMDASRYAKSKQKRSEPLFTRKNYMPEPKQKRCESLFTRKEQMRA